MAESGQLTSERVGTEEQLLKHDVMGRVVNYDTSAMVPGGPPDGYGGKLGWQYDLAGLVKTVESGANGAFQLAPIHSFQYAHDGSGRLSAMLYPVPNSLSNPWGFLWRAYIDPDNNLPSGTERSKTMRPTPRC
jgi:hypothetical protein